MTLDTAARETPAARATSSMVIECFARIIVDLRSQYVDRSSSDVEQSTQTVDRSTRWRRPPLYNDSITDRRESCAVGEASRSAPPGARSPCRLRLLEAVRAVRGGELPGLGAVRALVVGALVHAHRNLGACSDIRAGHVEVEALGILVQALPDDEVLHEAVGVGDSLLARERLHVLAVGVAGCGARQLRHDRVADRPA